MFFYFASRRDREVGTHYVCVCHNERGNIFGVRHFSANWKLVESESKEAKKVEMRVALAPL